MAEDKKLEKSEAKKKTEKSRNAKTPRSIKAKSENISKNNTKEIKEVRSTKKDQTVTPEDREEKVVQDSFSKKAEAQKKGVKVKVRTLLIAGTIVLLVALLYLYKDQFIVASVNGEPITRWELIGELESQQGPQVLQNIITQKLIQQEAEKLGVNVTNSDVDAEIENIKQQFTAQGSSLEATLAMQGLTIEDIRDDLKTQLMIQRAVEQDNIDVSDDEARTYIETNELGEPTQETVEAVKEQLKQQKVIQESQMWLQNIRSSASINYYLFPNPANQLIQ